MARDFDGLDDDIDVTWGIDPNTTTFTLVGWVKADSFNGTSNCVIAQQLDGTGAGRTILSAINSSGNYKLETVIGGVSTPGSTTLSTGVYYHVAVTTSSTGSGTVNIYLNGVLDGTSTRDPEAANGHLRFGRHKSPSTSNEEWDGRMAHFLCYNRTLSAAEIKQCMYYPGSIKNGLVFYLPLFGSASPEPDYSGNGKSGTLENGTASSTDNPPINGLYYPRVFRNEYAMTTPAGGGGWPYTNTGCHVLLDRWRRVA